MIRKLMSCGALLGAMSLAACELQVDNPVSPSGQKVLASPNDAEALVGGYYKRWHAGLYGGAVASATTIDMMAAVMSFENFSTLANFCQSARNGFPRPTNANNVGNTCAGEQARVYFYMEEVVRVATSVLAQTEDPTFVSAAAGAGWSAARMLRAKAFAQFLRGLSLGYLGLMYHEGAIVSVGQAGDDPGALVPYAEVADSAYMALANAITHATAASAADPTITIPQEWIPTSMTLTMGNFVRVIRSHRARLRADMGRTPAERAAADWAAILDDAQNGIETDFDNITDPNAGPFNGQVDYWTSYNQWHQMPPWVFGMADTSGAYAAFMATPIDSRGGGGVFHMATPDLRYPQGTTRAQQQADMLLAECEVPGNPCKRYILNRPTSRDQLPSFGASEYDFVRFHMWAYVGDGGTADKGSKVFFAKAENDMLAAEAYIRQGNYASAAALINLTRTANGLDPVSGTAAGTPAAPTHPCIPIVPVNAGVAGGGTVTCGNLMEAMKYEKRIETAQVHFAAWYTAMRGWGDLPEGTPTDWAPPYQELQARRLEVYSTGTGTPVPGAAAPTTYGW